AENVVLIELKRRGKEVYYWKSKKQHEIDFIIKDQDTFIAINVSYTDTINDREIKGLKEFKEEFGTKTKQLIILSKDVEERRDDIDIIPLWKWLIQQ
ncbi:MAG: DUF4143 domain-containing protein, partial [Candidatus Thermoplasmatota archaeon]|nr:DUF4143 domain-containing protein [Candidatus Thermoplasmatota archaeon]